MGRCNSKGAVSTKNFPEGHEGSTMKETVKPGRRRLSLSESAEARVEDGNDLRGTVSSNILEEGAAEDASGSLTSDCVVDGAGYLSLGKRGGRKLSVSGQPAKETQKGFDNKKQTVSGDGNMFADLGVGYACRKGLKPESPNQDDFFIYRMDDWALYGVFDGHGPCGHDVSYFVQMNMPGLICHHPAFLKDPGTALKDAFLSMQQQIEKEASGRGSFDCALSGTTATVVVHRFAEKKLWVAHVGDSRCVMGQANGGNRFAAVDLTNDHKPNLESERKRIVASGGQVKRLEGDIPHRVFIKGKLYPGLAMSRALGDTVGRAAGVIAEPSVSEFKLEEPRDSFILLCSDGVWEFITSEEAVAHAAKSGMVAAQASADEIAAEAWRRWVEEEGNVVDDITVQIIYLAPSGISPPDINAGDPLMV